MATPSGGSTPIAGRFGRFQVNGANANVEQFSGECSTERVECTSFEDQSNITERISQVVTDGVDKIVVNVKGYVDADNLPYGAYNIFAGADLENVALFLTKNDFLGGPKPPLNAYVIFLPWAKVFKVNYVVQVKDKIMFDCVIESNGPGYEPDEIPSQSETDTFTLNSGRSLRDIKDLPAYFLHE